MSHNTVEELNIELSDDFWDCECEYNYIHSKKISSCHICNSEQEEQPDSRTDEIDDEIGRLTISGINEIRRRLLGYITATTIKRAIQHNMRMDCDLFNKVALLEIDEEVINGVVDFWRHTIESAQES